MAGYADLNIKNSINFIYITLLSIFANKLIIMEI